MTSGPIEELSVPFEPGPTQARVLRGKRMLRSRLISFGISCVLLIVVYLWQRDRFADNTGIGVIYGLILAASLAWVVVTYVLYQRAKRALTSLGNGTAVRIDRRGVEVAGVGVPWPEVAGLAAVSGGLGMSPLFQVTRTSGEPLALPFDQLGVRPATLDTVARAFSGGRHGVDLTALDN